ncbi:MAG TPA: hypothetical protein VN238_16555 [Solirubrobacteraceae bacterium]|nr:hypothetical protein [Solirubrobacteraceae bacterium]
MRTGAVSSQTVAALCVVGFLGLIGLFLWSYGDTTFDDVPSSYATYRGGGVEFRHPPGWRATGDPATRLVLRPPGREGERLSPVIVLQRYRGEDALRQADRDVARLVQGSRLHINAYELSVDGADEAAASSTEVKARNGKVHSITTATATRDGVLTALTVRGRVIDGADNARNVAATLKLTG